MWKLRQKELELENKLNRKSADKNTDTCHSFSISERRSRERCDTDSGTSRSKKREIEDSHSCEEGLGDAEIEKFLHSRSVFLSKHLFVQRQKKVMEEIGQVLSFHFLVCRVSKLKCASTS